MTKTPSLSIIIPVYNVERYIERCINSIKSQSFSDFEAIVVDDGSKDASIEICESLVKDDSRFIILHKSNGGLMSAWKHGLKHASGDYIGFVDSDDWIDSSMYEVLVKSIEENAADIVVSGYVTEDNATRTRWTRDSLYIYEGDSIRNEFIKEYCCSYFKSISKPSICRWDKIYNKNLLLNNLDFFNEKISLAEDFNTNIPVILDAKKIILLPNFTPYHYRYNPKSIVNTINTQAFCNVKELGCICTTIQRSKGYESEYIGSFVGNIIFEEVNRILTSSSFFSLKDKELIENIKMCDGYYYLNCYARVRLSLRIYIYNWLIQHNLFSFIKLLTILNRLRLSTYSSILKKEHM